MRLYSVSLFVTTSIMKVVVLWWSGRMGQLVIQQALSRGRDVIALVRNPAKVSISHPQLQIVQWDATNSSDIAKVIIGCDVVVHTVSVPLRHRKPTHLYSQVTQAVIDAWPITWAPQQYIVMSSTGTWHGRTDLPWYMRWWYELMLWDVADDKEVEEQLLQSSVLPWIVIKAVILNDGLSSNYRMMDFADYRPWLQTISRTAVATAICDMVWDLSTMHKQVTVYYSKLTNTDNCQPK
jgi:NAD(P)H-binding